MQPYVKGVCGRRHSWRFQAVKPTENTVQLPVCAVGWPLAREERGSFDETSYLVKSCNKVDHRAHRTRLFTDNEGLAEDTGEAPDVQG